LRYTGDAGKRKVNAEEVRSLGEVETPPRRENWFVGMGERGKLLGD
jgi:hypothetical protein